MIFPSRPEFETAVAQCMLVDQWALRRRRESIIRPGADPRRRDESYAQLQDALTASQARRRERAERLPRCEVAQDLPIAEHAQAISELIAREPVVIVVGATGSGKTTQLPKCCLAAGRGVAGMIGCTQPRRIAARSVARRLSTELGAELGQLVGYRVRFDERTNAGVYVKVLTDGMLLSEVQSDRDLRAYDTLIIDEAHERSINIDLLLGYLKLLRVRRPDLKLIITSATMETERLSAFFDGAPVIEIPGRTFPIEVRYRPLLRGGDEYDELAVQQGVIAVLDELAAEGPGDVLVFLATEREIHATADALRGKLPADIEVLPLYARLAGHYQDRIFQPGSRRRIVLATNIAETSLTIPRIRYVIDAGYARVSRYTPGRRMQRLPVERIAASSAEQRKGRCGRVGPGICVRLYSEQDFAALAPHTEPEMVRSHLAGPVLRLKALGLGDPEAFPFLAAPDARLMREAGRTLEELGALDTVGGLTKLGRRMAALPTDPRVARVVLAAEREDCVEEILIIAAGLEAQDPRERPREHAAKADAAHRQFADRRSDFLGLVNLWRAYHVQRGLLSQRQLREWCREHFLSYVRIQQWCEIYRQLRGLVVRAGLRTNAQPASYASIHRALLAGFLVNIACRDTGHEYTGAYNKKLAIFPGSVLARKPPRWIVAAEQVQTSRLYARYVAGVDPGWIIAVAGGQVRREYSDAHWDGASGKALAFERIVLLGLTVAAGRRVNLAPIDPLLTRELFIRDGLVEGRCPAAPPFLQLNADVLREVGCWEQKLRRRDLQPSLEWLYEFYEQALPPAAIDSHSCARWYAQAGAGARAAPLLQRDRLLDSDQVRTWEALFPDTLNVVDLHIPLVYAFRPGESDDGITAHVPLWALNVLATERPVLERLVPGMLREKCIALIQSLPKGLRKFAVPVPHFVDGCLAELALAREPLTAALARIFAEKLGVQVPSDAWHLDDLPPYLFLNIAVHGADGRLLDQGRDFDALRQRWQGAAQEAFSALPKGPWQRTGITNWGFGDLPVRGEWRVGAERYVGYPALVDRRSTVDLIVVDDAAQAEALHGPGVLRLYWLQAGQRLRYTKKSLPGFEAMCAAYRALGPCDSLREDLLATAARIAFGGDGSYVRNAAEFALRSEQASARLESIVEDLCAHLGSAFAVYARVYPRLYVQPSGLPAAAYRDMREHLDRLVFTGFVRRLPAALLAHLSRYLRALEARLDRAVRDPGADLRRQGLVESLWRAYWQHPRSGVAPAGPAMRQVLEEYRVSLFAQELGTAFSVSPARLEAAWRDFVSAEGTPAPTRDLKS